MVVLTLIISCKSSKEVCRHFLPQLSLIISCSLITDSLKFLGWGGCGRGSRQAQGITRISENDLITTRLILNDYPRCCSVEMSSLRGGEQGGQ